VNADKHWQVPLECEMPKVKDGPSLPLTPKTVGRGFKPLPTNSGLVLDAHERG
jgi:hypothetical protein